MTRDDVIALFKAWRGAGLRPPMDKNSVEQANNMVDSFLAQYKNLTAAEVQMLIVKLSRLQFWPRFYDVDEALADFRNTKATAEKSSENYSGDRVAKMNAELRAMVGLPKDAERVNFLELMAEKCAGKYFLQGDDVFIRRNKFNLAGQYEFDYECENCTGKMSHECKFGCHRPSLRIDKYTGEAVMYVDSAKCSKHIENPNSYRKQAETSTRRSSNGFSSFGEVVN